MVVDPEAPRARAHDLVQALADARAAALVARDEGRLATVDHRGSPAWQLDANVIAALRDKGVRWEGLSLQVARATFVSGSGTTATIRARVDWTAYVVVHVDGTREARPADMGEELDLELVRVAAGWRIAAVSEPPAT
ncbi:hypothetical protein [Intrasporangium oryzae]|uniref:hypothetical protein n=1 Tax=Intrasporangium oryzae TaxID=412687 RepID=UPI0012FC4821|nr:hypothetical protein [Intrasporangium oryzae]